VFDKRQDQFIIRIIEEQARQHQLLRIRSLRGIIYYNLILKLKTLFFIGQKSCIKKIYHAYFNSNNKNILKVIQQYTAEHSNTITHKIV
jgi:hypothetical protein